MSTYSEIRAIMRAKGVTLEPQRIHTRSPLSTASASETPAASAAAVVESLKESGGDGGHQSVPRNGAAECKKTLLPHEVGRLPEDFIEGMACDGGCVEVPAPSKIRCWQRSPGIC